MAAHADVESLVWIPGCRKRRATSVLRWQGQPGRAWQGPTADVGVVDV